jgi:diguanylate cyclase (GGDEF)-like protein
VFENQSISSDVLIAERSNENYTYSTARTVEGHTESPVHPIRSQLRILIIEDNEDHAMLIQLALRSRGHMAILVHQGQQALEILQKESFDAVALDYQLPDATGLQMLDRLRVLFPQMPAVMVTASGSEQIAVSALKSGASDYVIKVPGYERELTRAIELAAEEARSRVAEAALRAELEIRATVDPLTGLLNRGEMERLIEDELRKAQRHQRPLSFALLDADGFKSVNDTYGHPAGDALLCWIAESLRSCVRSVDYVSRWGGDEFALLLPGATFGTAKALTNRVRSRVSAPESEQISAIQPRISLSIGFVSINGEGTGSLELLKWADRALYAAKAGGKDRANFFVLGDNPSEMPKQAVPHKDVE